LETTSNRLILHGFIETCDTQDLVFLLEQLEKWIASIHLYGRGVSRWIESIQALITWIVELIENTLREID